MLSGLSWRLIEWCQEVSEKLHSFFNVARKFHGEMGPCLSLLGCLTEHSRSLLWTVVIEVPNAFFCKHVSSTFCALRHVSSSIYPSGVPVQAEEKVGTGSHVAGP